MVAPSSPTESECFMMLGHNERFSADNEARWWGKESDCRGLRERERV